MKMIKALYSGNGRDLSLPRLGFSLICLFCLLVFGIAAIQKYHTYTRGKLVTVTVTDLPKPFAPKGSIKFLYNGKVYSKVINWNFGDEFRVGQRLLMRHVEDTGIFLVLADNPLSWILSFSFAFFLSCIYVFSEWKRSRNFSVL